MSEVNLDEQSLKDFIIDILTDSDPLSTADIIEKTEERASDCRDKVPAALMILWNEKKIKREISKERKVLLWSIVK